MNIYLIGLPGVGKSVIGQWLANQLNYGFIDTDLAIEEKESCSVIDLFKQKGEAYFRLKEVEVIGLTSTQDRIVISTGGGLPCIPGLMGRLMTHGTCVYLYDKIDNILERVKDDHTRPLLQADSKKEQLEALYHRRKPVYEQAHIHWDVNDGKEGLLKLVQDK